MTWSDPRQLLDLSSSEARDPAAIRAARRRRAKALHPDAGGADADMAALNRAADVLLAAADETPNGSHTIPTEPTVVTTRRRGSSPGQRAHDTASFTIEALPVVAFEVLELAAAELGEVAGDEQPYLLEVVMGLPLTCWCRLDVVPDAGASTVSVTLASVPGEPLPDLDDVRDAWVLAINSLGLDQTGGW